MRKLQRRSNQAGFALIELLLIGVILAAFVFLWTPRFARMREKTHVTIDLANFRQILQGSALYNAENDDRMPHPTWGADLTGPDGWAYLTSKAGRDIPGAFANFPGSCAGRDVNSAQFTNQLAFFKKGQVTQYLPNVKTAWCPKDVATRGAGRLKTLWIGRPMKVTSYEWTGTVGAYVGSSLERLPAGQTYTVSRFLPSDWLMWEINDGDSFNFNDAAGNPESAIEIFSSRHAGVPNWWTLDARRRRNCPGGAVVGKFGGEAELVRWTRVFDLINRKVPAPNELLNGPGYRR